MNRIVLKLVGRDVKRILNLRTLAIWVIMAAFTVFFFFSSNGRYELVENHRVEFMAIFLPIIVFGAWAVMSVYFDLVSSDREHNVLDCILCSGTAKKQVFVAKIMTTVLISLLLSFIYLAPITMVIAYMSDFQTAFTAAKYLLPLWGYIMVYASLGLMISVLARSSKAAIIWSLAIGLILMPRFFILIPEGIGNALHLSQNVVDAISLISPGIMMEALSNPANTLTWMVAAVGFTISVILLWSISYCTFTNQDEYNYGG